MWCLIVSIPDPCCLSYLSPLIILPYSILSYLILSYLTLCHLKLSYIILYYRISSYIVLYHLISHYRSIICTSPIRVEMALKTQVMHIFFHREFQIGNQYSLRIHLSTYRFGCYIDAKQRSSGHEKIGKITD